MLQQWADPLYHKLVLNQCHERGVFHFGASVQDNVSVKSVILSHRIGENYFDGQIDTIQPISVKKAFS